MQGSTQGPAGILHGLWIPSLASEVGGSGPVPQQPPVMQLLKRLVTLALPFALYLEDLVGVIT